MLLQRLQRLPQEQGRRELATCHSRRRPGAKPALARSRRGPVLSAGFAGALGGEEPSRLRLQEPLSGSDDDSVYDEPPSVDMNGKEDLLSNHRWKIVAMMALSFVLCNMDKVNMSVAVIPMAAELGWSATERGLVSSAFFWGYALTQVPAGYISTRLGGAKVLMAGVALWSFGTLIAPPAAQMSLLALCASRVLVGLGEGFAPSAATSLLAARVPPSERSRAVTTVFGGLDVGSAVGLTMCGPLIQAYGWPSVFYLFAAIGLVWCAFWPLVKPDQVDPIMRLHQAPPGSATAASPSASSSSSSAPPATHEAPASTHLSSSSSSSSSAAANGNGKAAAPAPAPAPAAAAAAAPMPWGKFFCSAPVWAIICAHFCYNWGYYTLLSWLPSYFELALGLNVAKSSFLTLIPYVAMTCMTPFVGPVADGLAKRGVELTKIRKICQGISFAGPAACMLACAMLSPQYAGKTAASAAGGSGYLAVSNLTAGLIVGLLSVAFALGAWARAGLYCNHQDLSPKYAGALLGITNTAGALPGVLGVTAAGALLDVTRSWALALFVPTAFFQLFGLIVYSALASSVRQPWE